MEGEDQERHEAHLEGGERGGDGEAAQREQIDGDDDRVGGGERVAKRLREVSGQQRRG